jgi:RND family efflux transporter MFP subunit
MNVAKSHRLTTTAGKRFRSWPMHAAGLAALALLLGVGCSTETEQAPPEVVRPVKTMIVGGSLAGNLTFPGRVQGARRVELSFRVGGHLIELPILEGQAVNEGDLIGRLDPTDYQIAVQEAQATFMKAEADFDRYQRLYEKDAVPLSDLERFRALHDVARARLEQSQLNLRYTSLRAPFGGRLGEKYVENHEDVTANQPIVSLHDITFVEIVIDVPEYLLTRARQGSDVSAVARFESVSSADYPLQFKEASAQADPETQTYKVTMSMPQPKDMRVLPGMTALVTVTLDKAVDESSEGSYAFSVPAAAVFESADGTQCVWVVGKNEGTMTVSRRKVTVGEVTSPANVYILDGLLPGDRVVTAAVTRLREGMQVSLWEK